MERALHDLTEAGVQLIEVKTLDASAGYEPYEAARSFWERRGSMQIDCIDPLPGWQRAARRPSTSCARPDTSSPRSPATAFSGRRRRGGARG